jgi:hypothetical protein
MPKMSTYAIGAIIDKTVSQMPPETAFVNVGAWHGFTFLSGIVGNPGRKCVCIDNFSEFGGPRDAFLDRFHELRSENHHFYDMDYIDYFARVHEGGIGFYVYDGEHSYCNQLRGLEVAEPFFVSGCVIMVDDTNTEEPRRATMDFLGRRAGQYDLILDERTRSNNHPTFWNGVMLLVRT